MIQAVHGGGVARAAQELGVPVSQILDFSASINPLGIPEAVLAAARGALLEAVHYPEIDAASLRAALADFHRLPAGLLLPGSGSTELLYLFPRVLRPRRALLVTPAFSEYARALAQAGVPLDTFPLDPEDGFRLDSGGLADALRPDTDLVILANPGNPSGAGVAPCQIEALACRLAGRAALAVDEAFVDFCPDLSVIDRVGEHDNLYVFRSLTKFYAIPGLRAGYMAGPAEGIAALAASAQPWALSTPALAAARACLGQAAFRRLTLEKIPELRHLFARGLAELGLKVFPSKANYLLARLAEGAPDACGLAAALRRQGLLIRNCADFSPLDGRYIRFAVRRQQENDRLLEALGVLLQGGEGR